MARPFASWARHAGFVPLSFELGEAFQFDWNCENVIISGLRRRLEVAHTKLAACLAYVLAAYFTQSHEMLFDAHTRAFAVLGGMASKYKQPGYECWRHDCSYK